MLDTALRITRAEAGLGREAFVEIDLATMIRDLVEMFEPLAEDRGMTVSATVPATLPIVAHREILGQALANLVDNALKYGDGQVEVTATRVAGGVAISVVDDGPGIPADRRPEAMKRFGRLDAARSESGAGLGLTLAAAVAHLHDGTLTLEDNRPGLIARLTLGG
jgi:signal transduction histidine kinase